MKTQIESLKNKVKSFETEMYYQAKSLLCEMIDEYDYLRKHQKRNHIPIKLEYNDYKIVGIDYYWNEDEMEEFLRYAMQRRNGNVSIKHKFTTQELISICEQIDKLNEPYRKLLKYRESNPNGIEITIIHYNDYKKQKESIIKGNTLEDLFIKLYNMNRTYRYCNGTYFKCKFKQDKENYNQWQNDLPKEMSFDLYYGNGIVD